MPKTMHLSISRSLGMKKLLLSTALALGVFTVIYFKIKFIPVPSITEGRSISQFPKVAELRNPEPRNLSTSSPITSLGEGNLTWVQAAAIFEKDLRRPRDYKCSKIIKAGNWPICQDVPYTVEAPCLVYSFGIAFDFSFDNAMAKLGCEVHSFDPSMNKDDYVTETGVNFHNIGLGGQDDDQFTPRKNMYVRNNQKWKLLTLKSVKKILGHEDRTLDVLKIDIEGHEWAVMENLINTNMFPRIRQFMLEWHLFPNWPSKSEYNNLLAVYETKNQIGLKKYKVSMHPLNHSPKQFNIQADVWYVNSNFLKPLITD